MKFQASALRSVTSPTTAVPVLLGHRPPTKGKEMTATRDDSPPERDAVVVGGRRLQSAAATSIEVPSRNTHFTRPTKELALLVSNGAPKSHDTIVIDDRHPTSHVQDDFVSRRFTTSKGRHWTSRLALSMVVLIAFFSSGTLAQVNSVPPEAVEGGTAGDEIDKGDIMNIKRQFLRKQGNHEKAMKDDLR